MRKRLRILILAAIVAAVVVPVGFALSLDARARASAPTTSRMVMPATDLVASSPIVATTTAAMTALPELSDGMKLFAVGTVLCGLAAAVRRSH